MIKMDIFNFLILFTVIAKISADTNETTPNTPELTPTTLGPTEAAAEPKPLEPTSTTPQPSTCPKEEPTPAVTEPPPKPTLMQRVKFHGQHNHIQSSEEVEAKPSGPTPCTCGVFLSGQFKKGSKEPPKGLPVLTQEMDNHFMNNAMGHRQCTNKCLEMIIKHLPKSGEIICATVDREHVYKERAYLFIKNHSDRWHGTNLSAGREFCCEENVPYKCPVK